MASRTYEKVTNAIVHALHDVGQYSLRPGDLTLHVFRSLGWDIDGGVIERHDLMTECLDELVKANVVSARPVGLGGTPAYSLGSEAYPVVVGAA